MPAGAKGSELLQGTITIAAEPARLALDPDVLGTTTIEWLTYNQDAEVWVSMDGDPEKLFARAPAGTKVASFIQLGHYYLFRLYEGIEHSTLLAWTSVTTQSKPTSQLGFNYWPANNGWPNGGWGSAALDDANWSVLRTGVTADLDHAASLGAGIVRLMFWPEANAFTMPSQFSPEYYEQTRNLVELISLLAARNLQVIISFANDYLRMRNDTYTLWGEFYGDSEAGFQTFLRDSVRWIDGYVNAIEASPWRLSVICYDYQNEYNNIGKEPNQGYTNRYVAYLYDSSAIPDGKRGVSLSHAFRDASGLKLVLDSSPGPLRGLRHLDFIDFHVYPESGQNADIVPCVDHLIAIFPGAVPIVGEFGYSSGAGGQFSEASQTVGVVDVAARCEAQRVSYFINWQLCDDHSPLGLFQQYSWGYDVHTPKLALAVMARRVGVLTNSNFEAVDQGLPVGWQLGATPGALSLDSPLKVVGAAPSETWVSHCYASIAAIRPGQVWLSSDRTAVIPGRTLYVNAFLRSSMSDVCITIVEYDAALQRTDRQGPKFTPPSFRFYNYLQQAGAWNVTLSSETRYVIVNISATCAGPSFLDIGTVSLAQR